jgi:hypothetical protein
MQAQYSKSEHIIESCVDYLISNRELSDTRIYDIAGEIKDRMNITFIPQENHPFDHFLVFGRIGYGNKPILGVSQKNIQCEL